jgi:hypothetical protein
VTATEGPVPSPNGEPGHDDGLERFLVDQTLSDSDQTVSDTDQTLSDADQQRAECDRDSSDRDRRASDLEQAAADETWAVKPGASLADLATIDLRRITDVLQVDHASLFLRDPDDARHAAVVAETGLPVGEALPEHGELLARVLCTGCPANIQSHAGTDEPCCAALATPLVCGDRAVGAVLVVTRRASRRLGAIDSQVIQRATRDLVERFLAPGDRRAAGASDRSVPDAPAARR